MPCQFGMDWMILRDLMDLIRLPFLLDTNYVVRIVAFYYFCRGQGILECIVPREINTWICCEVIV